MSKAQYVTVAPFTPKGKWLVCSRRIGTKDRLSPVAECRNEIAADTIVNGLNLLQGEVSKLEAPSAMALAAARTTLTVEYEKVANLRAEIRTVRDQLEATKRLLRSAEFERDLAQKKARETASQTEPKYLMTSGPT